MAKHYITVALHDAMREPTRDIQISFIGPTDGRRGIAHLSLEEAEARPAGCSYTRAAISRVPIEALPPVSHARPNPHRAPMVQC
jgi:hypothetical protein